MRPPSNRDIIDGLKKGPWTQEEDKILIDYIQNYGQCSWQLLPKKAGLNRCGKSCRLRWTNYLRPDIKRGNFSVEEEQTIIDLHSVLGNKWSMMATRLPGRTDNEIKNYWNTHIRKRLLQSGIDPITHKSITDFNLSSMMHTSTNLNNLMNNPILENLAKIRLLFNTLQVLKTNPLPTLHFDGNGILNPLQLSSKPTNVLTIEPFSSGYQPVFNAFGTIPELLESRNKVILEVSSSNELHSDLNLVQIPNYNQLFTSNNYIWGEVMDGEGSSSCWNDVFNDSFADVSTL